MKGKGGDKPSTWTLRASRHNENSGAVGAKVEREEEADPNVPGPLAPSEKQPIKREPKAESPLKPRKRHKVKKEDPVAAQMVKVAPLPPTAYTGPYPKHMRPSPEECRVSAQAPRLAPASCHSSLHVIGIRAIFVLSLQICPEAELFLLASFMDSGELAGSAGRPREVAWGATACKAGEAGP